MLQAGRLGARRRHLRALYTPDPPITDPHADLPVTDPVGVPAEPPELLLGLEGGSWAALTMLTVTAVILAVPASRRFTTLEMTMNVYGHINLDTQRVALDHLDEQLSD